MEISCAQSCAILEKWIMIIPTTNLQPLRTFGAESSVQFHLQLQRKTAVEFVGDYERTRHQQTIQS